MRLSVGHARMMICACFGRRFRSERRLFVRDGVVIVVLERGGENTSAASRRLNAAFSQLCSVALPLRLDILP